MHKTFVILAILITLAVLFQVPPQASSLLSSPTPTPQPEIPQVVISVTLREEAEPAYHIVSDSTSRERQVQTTPITLRFSGQLPASSVPSLEVEPTATTANFVDNWDLLLDEDFEGVFPQGACAVYDDSNDGFERSWDDDDYRPFNGYYAAWPANGGADGVDPSTNDYPANLDSWLICGPYDLSNAQKFLVKFYRWMEINDSDDMVFVGASPDGQNFSGLGWHGTQGWVHYNVWFDNVADDDSVWVAWGFQSDDDEDRAEGAWIDDLEVWRYNTPDRVCGDLDPGSKGIVLPPYDPVAGSPVPMIRAGDTIAVDKLKSAGVDWVRLGFVQTGGIVDWQAYDRMVDTLCAQGISVLGLVNHETLARQDYNEESTATEYRQEFVAKAGFAADYFEGRLTYWEIWNEQNLGEGAFVNPVRYAPLLNETYQAITDANPQAQVLFGGLASAWGDSNNYLVEVYDRLDNELGGARPFDYFAVHPYARVDEGPDPQVYMYADQPDYDTIVDKFMETMSDNNDGDKRVWITEVGWNSSKGSPTRPACLDPVLVSESEQAAYLKPMFDILFDEVDVWGSPGTPAIEKVVWYQYMDIGIDDPCTLSRSANGHVYVSFQNMMTAGSVDWWFGL